MVTDKSTALAHGRGAPLLIGAPRIGDIPDNRCWRIGAGALRGKTLVPAENRTSAYLVVCVAQAHWRGLIGCVDRVIRGFRFDQLIDHRATIIGHYGTVCMTVHPTQLYNTGASTQNPL